MQSVSVQISYAQGFTLIEVLLTLVLMALLAFSFSTENDSTLLALRAEQDRFASMQQHARSQSMRLGGGICLEVDSQHQLRLFKGDPLSGEQTALSFSDLSYDTEPQQFITYNTKHPRTCYDSLGRVCPLEEMHPQTEWEQHLLCPLSLQQAQREVRVSNKRAEQHITLHTETGFLR